MSSSWGKIYIWRLLKMHKNEKCICLETMHRTVQQKFCMNNICYLIGIAYIVK